MMLNRSKTRRSLFVECRHYFDKSGANSYYSAQVFVDGRHLYTTGPTYGYSDQYDNDVCTELVARGYLPAGMAGRRLWRAVDAGLDVYTVKYDVSRRDLWPSEDNQATLDAELQQQAKQRQGN
jgi:hypothetical protein